MAVKKILTVGLQIASDQVESESFQSKTSLLDWDIILFRPDIDELAESEEEYKGKPSLDDSESFKLKQCCEHWRREIKQAMDTGKTIIVFLAPLVEVFVDSGKREHSGTGRNRQTTRLVAPYSSYESIPAPLEQVVATGSSMKLARGADVIAPYWEAFGADSRYEVLLMNKDVPACILTKNGDKPAGAVYRSKSSSGALLLLPDLDFYRDEFFKGEEDDEEVDAEGGENAEDEDDEDDEEQPDWTSAAEQFAARLVGAVVAMDHALHATTEITPEPSWATEAGFRLPAEGELRTKLLEAEAQVEQAQKQKESIEESLRTAGSYRALLFEKGKPLENAIIEALGRLGFTANPYKDSESEFDVVFESREGRFIGEAEGKDSKAVNIDKLRQLAMNIQEDLLREETSSPAKGVLFGNGYRLQSLQDRADPFTDKCKTASSSMSLALVFTPDLFALVQYLLGVSDETYSQACRLAILNTVGRVTFPSPPAPVTPAAVEVREG
jgi:hypothetical protein